MFLFDSKVLNLIIQTFFFLNHKKKAQSMILSSPGNPMVETSKTMVLLGERDSERLIVAWKWFAWTSPKFGRSSDLSFQMKHSIVFWYFWFDSRKVFVGADLYSYLIILSLYPMMSQIPFPNSPLTSKISRFADTTVFHGLQVPKNVFFFALKR